MSGRLKAVVFDLDGTLLDTMSSAPQAYVDTIRALGGPLVTADEIVAIWHIGPTPVVLRHFLGREIHSEDVETYYAHLEQVLATVRPFSGVPELIASLAEDGFRLGVFTSATRRAAVLMLSATGLEPHFAALVGGDEVKNPKPAPDGLYLACQRIGADVTDIAYVGDHTVDLLCAGKAGVLGVHAMWCARAATIEGSHPVARHPAELTQLIR